MTRMKLILPALLLLLVGVAGFVLGRHSMPRITHIETQVDTLVIRDTITRETPRYTRVYVRDSIYITVLDTLRQIDTVWLPREVKIYEDERYRAEVSGYRPSLDRIDIYTQDRVVTQEVVKTVKQKTRWGVGISAGYGVAINTTDQTLKPSPYIGIGIHYNLISW